MKKHTYIICILSLLIAVFACEKQPKSICTFYIDSVTEAYFSFRLVDSLTMQTLIGDGVGIYDDDLVAFVRSDGAIPRDLYISGDGSINFKVQDNETEALDSSVTKIFYLQLPDQFGHPNRDTDTLKFIYRYNDGNCFSNFQVYYNGRNYHNGLYKTFFNFFKQ
ncbi:MAG: hypothetical protein KA974_04105 [Saprospiraceae bacterium]|nr:hypothetical protein [Saprospiraceae bacterium]MBP7699885.1 hypothetical protein [Saprospiraceae bacterium]